MPQFVDRKRVRCVDTSEPGAAGRDSACTACRPAPRCRYESQLSGKKMPPARDAPPSIGQRCRLMDVGPVLDRVAALTSARPAGRAFVLVGIGGHGAAGKTTLARSIPGAQVVGTDEFWDGAEFELSRLRADVLEPVLRGERAEYRAFSLPLASGWGEIGC